MVKVIRLFIIISLMLLWGCHEKYDKALYNLRFHVNHWIEIDFNSREIKVDMIRYKDSLILTEREEQSIRKAFEKNRIGKLKGEIFLGNEIIEVPTENFVISIYKKRNLLADVTINVNYKPKSTNSEGYRIANFKNVIESILQKNKSFKKAQDALYKHIKENKIILM